MGAGEALLDGRTGVAEGGKGAGVEVSARLPDERALHPAEDAREATDVVDVEVGEDQQVDACDAESVEAGGGEGGFASDVDHGDVVAVPDEECVALADIAGGELPGVRKGDGAADDGSAEDA